MIKLVNDTISHEDIDALADWLRTYPRLTMGDLTKELEVKWSEWLGIKYSVFVNSGSSANLMMLYAAKYLEGIETVAVPTLSWATDLAPVMQLDLNPVLIDCNLDDLSVDLGHLEESFKNKDIDALILVSVLGLIPNMKEVVRLCKKYHVLLLEDVCESMGSEYYGQKLGTFGQMSSFSLYFGHTISTIEGGFISTDDGMMYNALKMMRSHGWSRDLNEQARGWLKDDVGVDDFSELYTFYVPGFNLRATDLQAFIGLRQLDQLDYVIARRSENFHYCMGRLNEWAQWTPKMAKEDLISNHAYPILSPDKKEIVKRLQEANIEVRPLIAGSMGMQPFYAEVYGDLELPNATIVDKNGFYIPNHPGLSEEDLEKILINII